MSSATINDEMPCGVCGGRKKEHFDDEGKPITQHVFSSDGRLISHADAAKARQIQPQRVVLPSQFAGTDAQVITKLIEVLMDKSIISNEEALYIFGVAPKPAPATGFNDPARLFGTGTC